MRNTAGSDTSLFLLSMDMIIQVLGLVLAITSFLGFQRNGKKEEQSVSIQDTISTQKFNTNEDKRLEKHELVVLVLTARSEFLQRTAIRKTWAKGFKNVVFLVGNRDCLLPVKFLKDKYNCSDEIPAAIKNELENGFLSKSRSIGAYHEPARNEINKYLTKLKQIEKTLKTEVLEFGDVHVLNLLDTYRNLPAKLKSGYRFAVPKFPYAKWFVKVDTDMYLDLGRLTKVMAKHNGGGQYLKFQNQSEKYTVLGRISTGKVNWNPLDKNGESNYKHRNYPPFPIGSFGHVVSRKIAEYVGENAYSLENHQGEDVSLGIWIDENQILQKNTEFMTPSFITNFKNCSDLNRLMIGHRLSIEKVEQCHVSKNNHSIRNWSFEDERPRGVRFCRYYPCEKSRTCRESCQKMFN